MVRNPQKPTEGLTWGALFSGAQGWCGDSLVLPLTPWEGGVGYTTPVGQASLRYLSPGMKALTAWASVVL
jgi:hypothetical protein